LLSYYKAMWEKKLRASLKSENSLLVQRQQGSLAAVLLLIAPQADERHFEILLTKRTQWVEKHKGQVSLPGGFREDSDQSWLETALRETFEEIGVKASSIEILGVLPAVKTKGAVEILPFVGLLQRVPLLQISPQEVDRVIFLPSQEFLKGVVGPVVAQEQGLNIPSRGFYWDGELIWGATARILEQLYEILKT